MRNAYGDGAGDVSRFLSPVDDAGEQEKSSDIPGNGSGEEAEDESTKKNPTTISFSLAMSLRFFV